MAQVFPREFFKMYMNTYFAEHLQLSVPRKN